MEKIEVKELGVDNTSSIKGIWNRLEKFKYTILQRARKCAELTIPSLLLPSGATEQTQLLTPYQSVGARGVNNIAAKLLLALLPPNSPCFKLLIDEFTLDKMFQGNPQAKTAVDAALAKVERATTEWIEAGKARVPYFEALKQLACTGNVLTYIPDKEGMKIYKLDQYCVKRDPLGNVIQIVIKEQVHPMTLKEDVRNLVKVDMENPDTKVEIYTLVDRDPDKWKIKQEINGINIPSSEGEYPLDDCPYNAQRWSSNANEDYGRGIIEEYLGDLISLEGLMKAIVLGSAAAAKVVFLVNPNGVTDPKKLAVTENGGFVAGLEQDVAVLQLQKFADFKIASETIDRLERRLAQAFLLNSAVQRDAERVTAEEIRYLAGELEDAYGGVYSLISQETQLPFIRRMMKQMEKNGKLPKIPTEVKPVITTGLAALGRGHDLNKLNAFINQLSPLGPEVIAQYLKVDNYITQVGTALGIDTTGLVNTQEEVNAMNQARMVQDAVRSAAPGVAGEVAKGVVNAQTQQ